MNPDTTSEINTQTNRAFRIHIRPALSDFPKQSDTELPSVGRTAATRPHIALLPLERGLAAAAELFAQDSSAEMSAGWFRSLAATTLRPGESAVLALISTSGIARAALPLVRSGAGTLRGLTALYTTRFGVAAQSPADAAALGRGMGALVAGVLRLDAWDRDCAASKAFMDGLKSSGLAVAQYRHFANWRQRVDDFSSYWASRPSRLQQTVRRKSAKALGAGLKFLCVESPDDIAAQTPRYLRLYAECGKVAEPDPDFLPTMMRNLGAEGSLRLGFLLVGAETAAAQIWLVKHGRATIFKLAHHPRFIALSAGTLLTHRMFTHLLSRDRITAVDFGRGNDGYKRDWLDACDFREGVIACNPTSVVGLCHIATNILPTWAGQILRRSGPSLPQ
jgi:Acetyltransferase (GNAT) domain